eukprot:CAMPEP_0178955870 /NCGR_PEP_ID=MMETSP0789-20121207/9869_1 /TAXON_ID=3005 /ORGANISM="Rhizosolenia setigera, Strain CCMP 1694" /LENGTH=735 /DNA_ID=CAMNT_0020637597 /DNA_START=199 /DNA_END=2409 /DNA_ORIENTATION=+
MLSLHRQHAIAYLLLTIITTFRNNSRVYADTTTDKDMNMDSCIDMHLVFDLFPQPSQSCLDNISKSNHKMSYTFNYSPSPSTYWHESSAPYEQMNFLAEMKSTESTLPSESEGNSTTSWKIRIGQGGNIYSFESAFGQAVPPQFHGNAPFIDEVTQLVSVNTVKNKPQDHEAYFIHEAGSYMTDGEYTKDKPFYSPSIAKYCKDRSCAFASWPQQAHLPTIHRGVALYYTMYTDCGDGVIEFNEIIHNAETDEYDGDVLSYLNTPWGGPRKSTLRSFLQSDRNGELEHRWPLHDWGTSPAENLSSLGGYTIFAQNVLLSEESCKYDLPVVDGETIQLIVGKAEKPTTNSDWHTDHYGVYTVRTRLRTTGSTEDGCHTCYMWFTNARTGDRFVTRVLHFSWDGIWLYHFPEDIRAYEINKIFLPGDEILVSCANNGRPLEENLGLTHVYGFPSSSLTGNRIEPTRMLYGSTTPSKDWTTFTINSRVSVEPGDTYMYRQYMMTGEVKEHQEQVDRWVNEAYDDIYHLGELVGHGLELYYIPEKDTDAGTVVLTMASESKSFFDEIKYFFEADLRCRGSTVPSLGKVAHFFIRCGEQTYVGSDRYYFAPSRVRVSDSDVIRSYVCAGEEDVSVRPSWKLLGYFEEGSCGELKDVKLSTENFCRPEQRFDFFDFSLENGERYSMYTKKHYKKTMKKRFKSSSVNKKERKRKKKRKHNILKQQQHGLDSNNTQKPMLLSS